MQTWNVIIIGAGGAGMMCAIQAAKRGRKVLLVEHAQKIGRKILISGGGRCNFTNVNAGPHAFVSKNPHFCKSALTRFKPDDFIRMVEEYRIPYHEKKLGQLFCDGSAQNVVDLLVESCRSAGVEIQLDCNVHRVDKNTNFVLETSHGRFAAQSLVVATGGLSIPKIGATGFGYNLARQFDLRVVQPAPALVGLVLADDDLKTWADLAGVSIDSLVTCNGASFRENILFTHHGLSGPAILQASLYWRPDDPITIDLLPGLDLFGWLTGKRAQGVKSELRSLLGEHLPKRFAERFLERYPLPGPLAELSDQRLSSFCQHVHNWELRPRTTVGYGKAEVTRGGVDTDELSSKTMETKKVPGLYFIGEVVDVTGWLGGYNFQWAWASGFAAGQFV